MTALRHVEFPPPACSPRNTLHSEKQSDIDSILKDLKTCTRKLQAALASHRVELQVLEKLYYKGNNQHRTALFWRRVADVRRYGRRLEELNINEHLETLRLSFWGEPSGRSAKALKGPWSYVPNVQSVLRLLERLRNCLVLVESMEEHLTKAYNHLNLDLQTGAFLQLILTLTAITSRMAVLSREVGPIVANAWAACFRVLGVLDSDLTARPPKYLGGRFKATDPRIASTSKIPPPMIPTSQITQHLDEDLGSAVTTAVVKRERLDSVQDTTGQHTSSHAEEMIVIEDMGFMFSQPAAAPVDTTVVRATVQRASTKRKDSENPTKKRTKVAAATAQEGLPKKQRKKKDEIDDIFGF